jgi:hypothetical protein
VPSFTPSCSPRCPSALTARRVCGPRKRAPAAGPKVAGAPWLAQFQASGCVSSVNLSNRIHRSSLSQSQTGYAAERSRRATEKDLLRGRGIGAGLDRTKEREQGQVVAIVRLLFFDETRDVGAGVCVWVCVCVCLSHTHTHTHTHTLSLSLSLLFSLSTQPHRIHHPEDNIKKI